MSTNLGYLTGYRAIQFSAFLPFCLKRRDREITPTLRCRDSEIPPTVKLNDPRPAICVVDGDSDLCYTDLDQRLRTCADHRCVGMFRRMDPASILARHTV